MLAARPPTVEIPRAVFLKRLAKTLMKSFRAQINISVKPLSSLTKK